MNKYSISQPIFNLIIVWLMIGVFFMNTGFTSCPSMKTWKREMYLEINLQNFRKQAIFHQKIDFDAIDYGLMNACLFFLTNEQRAQQGLAPIVYAAQLEVVAWHHSKEMQQNNFFSHINTKNIHRKTKDQRGRLAGIANPFITENIAFKTGLIGKNTYLEIAEIFVKQWSESPAYSKNIFSDKALQMGCGLYTDGKSWYVTQCFQWFRPILAAHAHDTLP